MEKSVTRRWLVANVIGLVVGMLSFGAIADSGWAEAPKLLNVGAHLLGFLAFGSLLAYLQRWALAARRTPFLIWAGTLSLVQFLAYGLAFELVGPPWDFVAGIVALGATTGLLLRREAVRTNNRWLVAKGALAGVAAVVGMVPVFVVADPINDAMGGGFAPFMVILALIGGVCGVALGSLLRPVRTVTVAA